MIYINNELFKRTTSEDRKSYEEFQTQFAKHLDPTGRIIKPIILKYTSKYIKNDPDNPGKLMMPRSLKLNFITSGIYDKQVAEIRYSKTSGRPNAKEGGLKFNENGTQVVGGQMAIYDIDLAYYLWRWSDQIATKPENADNSLAYFEIENLEGERKQTARLKAIASTINARLWNDLEDGGVSDQVIINAAKSFMIPNVDSMDDIIQVKLLLERFISVSHSNAEQFLKMTDKSSAPKKEQAERRGVIADAITAGILSQDTIKSSFHQIGADGKPEPTPIFTYKKGEKDPKGALYVYLEAKDPEFLDALKDRLAVLND
jgi:hypothetical protein